MSIQETLLKAISEIVEKCANALKSPQTPIDKDKIMESCLKEARKESLSYKVLY